MLEGIELSEEPPLLADAITAPTAPPDGDVTTTLPVTPAERRIDADPTSATAAVDTIDAAPRPLLRRSCRIATGSASAQVRW